jgi:hypothetical protein
MDHTTACTFVVGQVETLSEGTEDPYLVDTSSPRASPNLTRKKKTEKKRGKTSRESNNNNKS